MQILPSQKLTATGVDCLGGFAGSQKVLFAGLYSDALCWGHVTQSNMPWKRSVYCAMLGYFRPRASQADVQNWHNGSEEECDFPSPRHFKWRTRTACCSDMEEWYSCENRTTPTVQSDPGIMLLRTFYWWVIEDTLFCCFWARPGMEKAGNWGWLASAKLPIGDEGEVCTWQRHSIPRQHLLGLVQI